MTAPPMFHGFDGLMTLSRREGVDIRPTLLRVLTDLYVQAKSHTRDEEQQFSELASRLLDAVDDATRAAVRARLAVYPGTPADIARKLNLHASGHGDVPAEAVFETDPAADLDFVSEAEASLVSPKTPPTMSMQPEDAAQLLHMFLAADSAQRSQILYGLPTTPLKPSTPVDSRRAEKALATLESAALAADVKAFTVELADALILTARVATRIVEDPSGEPLACALKALGMSSEAFQRVLLFLNPTVGASVMDVYRLARLYDVIELKAALILLAAWRGATLAATRAKYRPALHDDERQRARAATPQARPAALPGTTAIPRNTSRG